MIIGNHKMYSQDDIGKSVVYINFENNDFFHHEKIYLGQHQSPFLKMNFMTCNGENRALYDTTGFVTVCKYFGALRSEEKDTNIRLKKREDVLLEWIIILRKTFEILDKAEDYLLFFHRFAIYLDCIYINSRSKDIKLLYLPCSNECVGLDKIMAFINEIEKEYKETDIQLSMRKIKSFILKENPSCKKIIQMLAQMQRDHIIAFGYD